MYPLDNVCFEVQDMNERFRWVDGSVDVIHARSISMAVRHNLCSQAHLLIMEDSRFPDS